MKFLAPLTIALAIAMVPLPVAGAQAQGRGNGQQKVAICHIPPGNRANAKTLTLPQPAVEAHLAHGDTLGPCPRMNHKHHSKHHSRHHAKHHSKSHSKKGVKVKVVKRTHK